MILKPDSCTEICIEPSRRLWAIAMDISYDYGKEAGSVDFYLSLDDAEKLAAELLRLSVEIRANRRQM